MARRLVPLVLLISLVPSALAAQPVHNRQHPVPAYTPGEAILRITNARRATPWFVSLTTTMRIENGRLEIISPGAGVQAVIPFDDMSVGEFATMLRGRFPDQIRVEPLRAQLPMAVAADGIVALSRTGRTATIVADQPSHLDVVFGASFVAKQVDRTDQDLILGDPGFTFDIVGESPFWLRDRNRVIRGFKVGARLALASNTPLPVNERETPNPGADLNTALTSANMIAFAATADLRLFWPNLSLSVEASQSWNTLDQIEVASLTLRRQGTDDIPVSGTFDERAIKTTSDVLNQIQPTGAFFLDLVYDFPRTGTGTFYVGLGTGTREQIERGLTFDTLDSPANVDDTDSEPDDDSTQTAAPGPPDPTSLRGVIRRRYTNAYRVRLGADIEGLFSLRAEAIAARGEGSNFAPILRVVVSKPFPIGS